MGATRWASGTASVPRLAARCPSCRQPAHPPAAPPPAVHVPAARWAPLLALGVVVACGLGLVWIERGAQRWRQVALAGRAVVLSEDQPALVEVPWQDGEPPRLSWDGPRAAQLERLSDGGAKSTTLLLTAQAAGATRLVAEFPRARLRAVLEVTVRQASVHEQARARRLSALRRDDPARLRRAAAEHLLEAQRLAGERSIPGKEAHYHQALMTARLAADCALAAGEPAGDVAPETDPAERDLLRRCQELEANFATDYADFARRQVALFEDAPAGEARARALERALRALDHPCDARWVRLTASGGCPPGGCTLTGCEELR